MKQFSQRLQASNVLITPDAEVTGPDATISVDSHRFGKKQPRLTYCASTIITSVPISD
ncbi:hypothetical protein D3C78_1950310 [compost metagenome]